MAQLTEIEPGTCLGEILAGFPQLESLLLESLPAFGQIKNSSIRASVAQHLSIEQAAATSAVNLPELVLKLRRAAGLPDPLPAASNLPETVPGWVKTGTQAFELDARTMLSRGEHPKEMVLKELQQLPPHSYMVLITPFVPAPLIELGRLQGFETWTRQREAGHVETYFGNS